MKINYNNPGGRMRASVLRLFFLTGLLGWQLAGCTNQPAEDEQTTEAAPAPPTDLVTLTAAQVSAIGLQTGRFDTTLISDGVLANGMVDVPAQQMASVSLPISGYVRTLRKLPGSSVGKGETLAMLESMEYIQMQQDYLQARSRLTFQQEELTRQNTLNEENVGARRRLQQAQADFESTRTLVDALEVKLKLLGTPLEALRRGKLVSALAVRAPIRGHIRAINVTIGKNTNPADVLFELVGTEHKHLELKIFEKDAYKIREGQKLVLLTPRMADYPVGGSIYLVGKTLEGDTKTLRVHGHINDAAIERRLLPGMYVSARILTGSRRVATLPDEAIVSEGDQRVIFIQEKSLTFRRIPVKTGQSENGQTEALPQAPIGNRLIVKKGAYLLQASTQETEED
ncbi:MAG: efflux RND transporter periplasmic adaptor subunit [Cytophagaceae bacterium]|nr:efflux RND transporter periplasmic adaptor subunit [Cytophagaceae bacterium]